MNRTRWFMSFLHCIFWNLLQGYFHSAELCVTIYADVSNRIPMIGSLRQSSCDDCKRVGWCLILPLLSTFSVLFFSSYCFPHHRTHASFLTCIRNTIEGKWLMGWDSCSQEVLPQLHRFKSPASKAAQEKQLSGFYYIY